jgi:hypothetical protein
MVFDGAEAFTLGNPHLGRVLTSGIVEMLLLAGADANCNVSLWNPATRVSAFAKFLLLPLERPPPGERWTGAFSTALRYFLEAGADLDYEVDMRRDEVKNTVCAAFATKLAKTSLVDMTFFASLTRQLLAHGIARKAEITPLIAAIPEVFTSTVTSNLFQIIPVEMRPTKRCRWKREIYDSSGVPEKRQRTGDDRSDDSLQYSTDLDERVGFLHGG